MFDADIFIQQHRSQNDKILLPIKLRYMATIADDLMPIVVDSFIKFVFAARSFYILGFLKG